MNTKTTKQAPQWRLAHITVGPREHAAILAALRFWQREHSRGECPDIDRIASENGRPLTAPELEALCERINSRFPPPGLTPR